METSFPSMEGIMSNMTTDSVDKIVEEWRWARPDLDPSPLLVIGSLNKLAVQLISVTVDEFPPVVLMAEDLGHS